jgi:hypothetical protein
MSDERTPGSDPKTLTPRQQLEASLAAGTITPELFATLSAQLPPDQPAAPPAPARLAFSPSGNDAELPSLLDMFNQPPAAPASPAPPTAPAAPAAPPAPAGPSRTSTADAAARRLIEERLTQIRQRPAVAPEPPKPAPAPTFYPEPPAPTFYPPAPVAEVASPPPAPPRAVPPRQAPPRPSAPVAKPASGGAGKWLLIVLLVLAVGGGLAYFFIQASHPDESLTSPSLPAAEPAPREVAAPKPAKKAKKSSKKKRKNKAAAPVAAISETEAAAEPAEEAATAASQPVAAATPARAAPAASKPVAAAAEAGDDAAATKVREVMASYYADLHAPPLHASQHFAPQVERLYIQQNLTPNAIEAELARSFFPENQQAVAQIEPGTLRVSAPAADGSRTATFTETMRLYRVSKQQFQRLRTNVRVRFNPDYQITYMRQEKLLANTFE